MWAKRFYTLWVTPPHLFFWCLPFRFSLYRNSQMSCFLHQIPHLPHVHPGLERNARAARVAVDRPPISELIGWLAFSTANWAHLFSHKAVSSPNLQRTNLFGSNIWHHFCWEQEFTLCRISGWSTQGLYGAKGGDYCLIQSKHLQVGCKSTASLCLCIVCYRMLTFSIVFTLCRESPSLSLT